MPSFQFPLHFQYQASTLSPEKAKLLVVLHGRGDSSDGFTWLKDELKIADLSVLLLDAPDRYYEGFSWYDLPPNQLPGITRSRELLERTFQELFTKGFRADNIILMGFSQGCLMTLEFGSRMKSTLAGYLGISGYCYDPEAVLRDSSEALKKANWFITHGTHDDVLPVERTRAQMNELKAGGFNLTYREYPKAHTIDPREELPMIREWIQKSLGLKQ